MTPSLTAWFPLAVLVPATVAVVPPASFTLLDPSTFAPLLRYGAGDGGGAVDETAWAKDNIPFFECDDDEYTEAYYFRWHMFHSHMNRTGWTDKAGRKRYLITEFTGVDKSHSGSAGHHLMEARWLRDPQVVMDYALYWADGAPHAYSFWYSWASYESFAVIDDGGVGVAAWLQELYTGLKPIYNKQWIQNPHYLIGEGKEVNGLVVGTSCFFKKASWDAEENSISGDGCRAISNACAAGEAAGLGRMAAATGHVDDAPIWANFTQIFQRSLTDVLWNEKLSTFTTLAVISGNQSTYNKPPKIKGVTNYSMTCNHKEYVESICDDMFAHTLPGGQVRGCGYYWAQNTQAQVREIGALSTPWMLGAIANDSSAVMFAQGWRALNDPKGFDAQWGPRTAERRHPCYNYTRYHRVEKRHSDNWNGPSWPYETSKMLTALSSVLNDFPKEVHVAGNISKTNFAMWMGRYVRSHTSAAVVNGSAAEGKNGTVPWIGENLHPDDGYWLSRFSRFRQNCSAASGPPSPGGGKPGCNSDELYNHSSFIDLIIAAIVGLRAAALSNILTLNPLGVDRKYFALDNLRYRGRNIAIAWDVDGKRYAAKGCTGLCVWVDGKIAAQSSTLGKLSVTLQ